ncbi:MAG: UDP-2,3-diacylglucosamine diphosphatase LpxI [Alphaproteobacteria bacterium]|nr:UDP-2,3-diacylglucosamine diphosphatase LpxI [Alphaproteobacteria bacterium]
MQPKLAIVAGGGSLPLALAEACRNCERPYFLLGLEGFAEASRLKGHPHRWARISAVGRVIATLREEAADEVVFAGHVRRPSLASLRPDLYTVRLLARIGAGALGDDGLMRHIASAFEAEGFRVVEVSSILADTLVPPGPLGRLAPDGTALEDIRRGLEVAEALGRADAGQAVVVQQGIVLAIEAAEGTDRMVARAAHLRRAGPGGVLVKMAKPQQDRRMDLPVIGPDTVEAAAAAGLRGIAVEVGGVLLLDRNAAIRRADDKGLFITGTEPVSCRDQARICP